MKTQTTYQILCERSKTHPDHPLFCFRTDKGWETITTAEGVAMAGRLAAYLLKLGCVRGDRVAVLSENRWEWPLVDLALRHMGGVVVGLYPTDSPSNWRDILNESECKFIFISPLLVKDFSPIQSQVPGIRMIDFDSRGFAAELHGEGPISEPVDCQPSDLATIIYTSGTTGKCKGAMLTHENVSANAMGAIEYFGMGMTDHYLSFLPICHAFERTALNSMMRGGSCIYFGRGLAHLVEEFGEVEPTIVCAVPRVLEKVYASIMDGVGRSNPVIRGIFKRGLGACQKRFSRQQAKLWVSPKAEFVYKVCRATLFQKIHRIFGRRLRYVVSGGAPLSPLIAEFFFSIGIKCYEGYGITECSPIVAANHGTKMRLGTVGEIFPGVEVKISDEHEILVRGRSVMIGYWKDEEATSQAVDQDGWFHTGDLGKIDSEGFLSIQDRKKEILVTSGGKNISPVRIETAVLKSPFISQCCVCADGRHFVSALVVPNFDAVKTHYADLASMASEELVAQPPVRQLIQGEINKVNESLARYESIRGFALIGEEFQVHNGLMTATLKMRRKAIETRYREKLDQLYGIRESAILES